MSSGGNLNGTVRGKSASGIIIEMVVKGGSVPSKVQRFFGEGRKIAFFEKPCLKKRELFFNNVAKLKIPVGSGIEPAEI